MNVWPHDNTADKNAFYGDFHSPGWQALNLRHYLPPFMMYYEKQPLAHGILVHSKIIPALDFGGCFNIRNIAGTNNWSNHSWACALDLWPSRNGFNDPNPGFTESSSVIQAFKRQGFRWGGNYHGRKDYMHLEAVQP